MKKARVLILLAVIAFAASSCFGKASQKGPEHFYFGNYSEAEKFFNEGEYQKAIDGYQAYISENPEGNLAVISRYYIAKSHQALGQREQAAAIYKQIMAENPELVWAKFSETQLKEMQYTSKTG